MKQKDKLSYYDYEMVSFEGKDIYVQADNYKEAKDWFDKNILQANVKMKDIQPDATVEQTPRIIRVEDVESLKMFTKAGRDVLSEFLLKGYDMNSGSYIFTMLDVYTQKHQIIASSFQDAEKKLKEGSVVLDTNLPQTYSSRVLSCDEDQKVVIDDDVMDIYGEEDLTKRLKMAYPDGLTIRLADESMDNLVSYVNYVDEELVKMMGLVNAEPDVRMLVAHGNLEAELKLKPDCYDILYACEETYYMEELSDLGLDTGSNATTVMLNEEESFDLREGRIETFVCETLLNNLYIEKLPYKDVMDIINRHHPENEAKLQSMLYQTYLDTQPDWKVKLAEENSREPIHKFWVEKLGPANREQRKMYNKTLEQAATENGYKTLADYKRDMEWTKNPSPQKVEKFNRIVKRHEELYKPFNDKAKSVELEKENLELRLQRNFCLNFDRAARKMITDVKFIPRMGTDWAVRCCINGQQMSGRQLNKVDAEALFKGNRTADFLHNTAVKYFAADIVDGMEQKQARGMQR